MKYYFNFIHRDNNQRLYSAQYEEDYEIYIVSWIEGNEEIHSSVYHPVEVAANLDRKVWEEAKNPTIEENIQDFYNFRNR